MYERSNVTLGFSLKPPKILRDAVNKVIGEVVHSVKVPVPTGSGTVVFTASSVPAVPSQDPNYSNTGGMVNPLLLAGGGIAAVLLIIGLLKRNK